MRYCAVCKKSFGKGRGSLFCVPKDPMERAKWSEICGRNLVPSSSICADHFPEASIARVGKIVRLLANAEPSVKLLAEADVTIQTGASEFLCTNAQPPVKRQPEENVPKVCVETEPINFTLEQLATPCPLYQQTDKKVQTEKSFKVAALENLQNIVLKNQNGELTNNFSNSNKSLMPPELHEEPIMEISVMPAELQEETLIEVPDFKSFSCTGTTQTNTRLCGLVEALELSEEFRLNCFHCSEVFPLEKWKNFADHLREKHFEIEDKFKTCKYVSEDHNYTSMDLTLTTPTDSAVETAAIDSKSHLYHLTDPLKSTSPTSYLECTNVAEEQQDVKEECKSYSIEILQQIRTEIFFEYTSREIVDLLLDSMKNYSVLWEFDDEPFNEDFYEAVEDLCKIINEKFSLNITNLKMRRCINRILRFYCYLYPNDNIEDIHQFTCYYDKCATFLPTSVNEIAYARCSHCYKCYKCDFELKPHLLKEYKKLQWPYKCVQCKECFIECDEYQFHLRLPHYREAFRCEQCNKTFHRRNVYNKHVADKHPKEAKYQCDVCEKVYKNRNLLRNHKLIHEEKKHKCHLCQKSFSEKGKLNLHFKFIHRRQYDFMCELCGQKLVTQSSLKEHMIKHTQEKITCNICNLKLRKSSLNRHLELLHVAYEGTIEQTSKGRHANYRRFVTSSPFRHRKKYSEKTYDCKICKIRLNYDSVIEHIKEFHPDVTKWSCKMCVMEFSLKRQLKRHYRRRHKLEQIYVNKLVEENLDLDVVLPYEKEHFDKLAKIRGSKCKQSNIKKSKVKTQIKSESIADGIYFVEEKNNISKMQDEIMKETLIDDDYVVKEKLNSTKILYEIMKADDDDIVTQEDFLIEFLDDS